MIWRIVAVMAILALAAFQILALQHLDDLYEATAQSDWHEATDWRQDIPRDWMDWRHDLWILTEAHVGHLVGTGLLLIAVCLLFVLPDQHELREAYAVIGSPLLASAACWSVWAVQRLWCGEADLCPFPYYLLGLVGAISGLVAPATGIVLATVAWRKRMFSKQHLTLLCLIGVAVIAWTTWFVSLVFWPILSD